MDARARKNLRELETDANLLSELHSSIDEEIAVFEGHIRRWQSDNRRLQTKPTREVGAQVVRADGQHERKQDPEADSTQGRAVKWLCWPTTDIDKATQNTEADRVKHATSRGFGVHQGTRALGWKDRDEDLGCLGFDAARTTTKTVQR